MKKNRRTENTDKEIQIRTRVHRLLDREKENMLKDEISRHDNLAGYQSADKNESLDEAA